MSIEIKVVDSKRLLKEYIFLPEKLYEGDTRWVPPMYNDEWAFHNPKKNNALSYCHTIRLIAYQDNLPVGRIMGIIHHPHNLQHNEKTVRFFNFDCVNDQQVASALIRHIENWGREKGMTKIIGPYGFSDKDPQGLQIEGFEHLAVIATPTNPSYTPGLVEHENFQKEIDCVSYQIPVQHEIPDIYKKVNERIQRNKSLKLLEFTSKSKLKPYIIPVFRLVNETYSHLFGFAPMTEEEMIDFADIYYSVLDPEFVKIVVNQQYDIIAFVVAMPDMSLGIQKAEGRLFPFGFFYILNSMRKATQLNLLLGAVKPGFRGIGVTAMLGTSLMESAIEKGITVMDSHLILESNLPMRRECERINGKVCKRYRVYSKMI